MSILDKPLGTLATTAPHILVNLLLAVSFLWYLHSRDISEDLVAKQRIEECHKVQAASSDALRVFAKAITEQVTEYKLVQQSQRGLMEAMRRLLEKKS